MAILLVLVLMIMFILSTQPLSAPPISPKFPIAKPNCTDRCGNISIPLPFGTNKDCFEGVIRNGLRDYDDFLVTCDETFSPPKLFMLNTSIEIKDISLDGQLTVMQSIAKHCHARDGNSSFSGTLIALPSSFAVNNTANKFIVMGCDSSGYIDSTEQRMMISQTTCDENTGGLLNEGYCKDIPGCSETSVPKDVSRVRFFLERYASTSTSNEVWDFNNCTYAFVVEEGAFSFSPHNLTNIENVEELPIVVDWTIMQWSCAVAQEFSFNYACKSLNSECYDPNNGHGYRCQCKQGYQGSPYLVDGCRDVDECKLNMCVNISMCENTQGGFKCSCPEGYYGDGRKEGTGCTITNLGSSGGESNMYKIVAGVSVGVTVVVFVTSWLYVILKRRKLSKMKQKYFVQNGGVLLQEKLGKSETSLDTISIFSSIDLQKATKNFNSSMIIGQGGFGTVYIGTLTDDRIVAVKKSKEIDPNQNEQFINEVIILSQINHRNVVKLLGCCLETQTPLLVYEFISNGTLYEHIHCKPKITYTFLNWDLRLKIATETAGVLSYLHSTASVPIIHRDVKSSNILLDDTFTAKVSDFGASRFVPLDKTRLRTLVQGTFGYLDPEYLQTNQLTEKSDVYSFGVVLVELLTSMNVLNNERPEEERNLSNFFLSMLKKEQLFQILDGDIVCKENEDQLIEVAEIAKGCLNVRGEDRPSMKEVARALEGLRLGKKHLGVQIKENAKEMDMLLGQNITRVDSYDGMSITRAFETSLLNRIISPLNDE